MHYRDKVAVVTGGASGIGRALCLALGNEGAIVVAVDLDEAGARAVAEAIRAAGGRAEACGLDVTRTAELEQTIAGVAARHGRLDFMFNNAGIGVGGEARDLTAADWKLAVDLNLMAVIHGTMAAYRIMLGQGGGHIVNTASAAGLLPTPLMAPYAATKFGVVGFSRAMRAEAADLGVRVTAVCPGFVESRIFDSAVSVGIDRRQMRAQVPFRFISAEDCAQRILAGVARNKALLVFPGYVHLLLWMDRLLPGLVFFGNRKAVRDFRKLRKDGYREEHRKPA